MIFFLFQVRRLFPTLTYPCTNGQKVEQQLHNVIILTQKKINLRTLCQTCFIKRRCVNLALLITQIFFFTSGSIFCFSCDETISQSYCLDIKLCNQDEVIIIELLVSSTVVEDNVEILS